MSVTTMALVFAADLKDIPYEKDGEKRNAKASTAKLLLLAYADHSNDQGKAAYPGYSKLEIKTALSRQGISDTLEALIQNKYLVSEGVSELGTNSYQINLNLLKTLVKPLDSDEKSSHLTGRSQATRRKPSINHPSPPSNEGEPPKPEPKKKANQYPELLVFKATVKRYPAEVNWEEVIAAVKSVNARLNREATKDDLLPFYKFWTGKGYNPFGLGWLEWAARGQTPTNGKVAEQWRANANNQRSNPEPEYSASDLALAARIVEQRAAQGLL
jgi:hypothetical protein